MQNRKDIAKKCSLWSESSGTGIESTQKRGQCADFSVKSQISMSYWIENSISEEQNYTPYTKT